MMKPLMITAAVLALIVMPAHAQMGSKRHQSNDKTDQKKPQVDEKAYKAALERIPSLRKNTILGAWRAPADQAKKPKQNP